MAIRNCDIIGWGEDCYSLLPKRKHVMREGGLDYHSLLPPERSWECHSLLPEGKHVMGVGLSFPSPERKHVMGRGGGLDYHSLPP